MIDESKFLLPEDDGLPMRSSQEYANYKLKALTYYLSVTNTAMRDKWAVRYFVDLQAGPGKNQIGNSVVLGSPLIALTSPYPSTHFRFNELNTELGDALEKRVSKSSLADQVKIYHQDVNSVVDEVSEEIRLSDRTSGSLNVAFLDPEGLELHWSTVTKLASIKRMDLIINFSTRGVIGAIGAGYLQAVDQFFGTPTWREVDKYPNNPTKRRRVLIDFYRQNLEKFGYNIEIDPDLGGSDIAVNNSRNSQVYSMLFASKHPLGEKFWKQAAKSVKPRKLPGFD